MQEHLTLAQVDNHPGCAVRWTLDADMSHGLLTGSDGGSSDCS